MIIHKLITQHLRNRDDADFYHLQARDAIRWIEASGVPLTPQTRALDLGCGHGIFGGELAKRGCQVTFADTVNYLRPDLASAPFKKFDIDRDDFQTLGQYDLVVCSNVFEHLSKPERFLESIHHALSPAGRLYLSWTNWLSPWGGHEFSPFHYLGKRRGQALYDKVVGKQRNHTVYENLFPTYIGDTLAKIRSSPTLKVLRGAPRYYTEFGFLLNVPIAREFLTWNCALLIARK
jgi:2-polyprenyl-3-methyl-5-hydroxy-6-metoxy-1,4-benzoquinol methylase